MKNIRYQTEQILMDSLKCLEQKIKTLDNNIKDWKAVIGENNALFSQNAGAYIVLCEEYKQREKDLLQIRNLE